MASEKIEYTHNDHEIVISFKEEPRETTHGNHSAWFEGGSKSVDLETIFENKQMLPDKISKTLPEKLLDATKEDLKNILNFMAENNLIVCNKCGRFFEEGTGEKIKFAGVKCPKCAKADKTCPESEDGKHDWKTLNPGSKNNAKVDTKYECKNCGKTRTSVSTG